MDLVTEVLGCRRILGRENHTVFHRLQDLILEILHSSSSDIEKENSARSVDGVSDVSGLPGSEDLSRARILRKIIANKPSFSHTSGFVMNKCDGAIVGFGYQSGLEFDLPGLRFSCCELDRLSSVLEESGDPRVFNVGQGLVTGDVGRKGWTVVLRLKVGGPFQELINVAAFSVSGGEGAVLDEVSIFMTVVSSLLTRSSSSFNMEAGSKSAADAVETPGAVENEESLKMRGAIDSSLSAIRAVDDLVRIEEGGDMKSFDVGRVVEGKDPASRL